MTVIICSHQVFEILLLELEPVCTAEQEFVQNFFDFTVDEPEVCVCGHIVVCVQFVFLNFWMSSVLNLP